MDSFATFCKNTLRIWLFRRNFVRIGKIIHRITWLFFTSALSSFVVFYSKNSSQSAFGQILVTLIMSFPNNIQMEFSILDHCALKEMKLSKLMEFPWRKSQMTRFNLLWEQFERIWSSAHEVIPQGIMK